MHNDMTAYIVCDLKPFWQVFNYSCCWQVLVNRLCLWRLKCLLIFCRPMRVQSSPGTRGSGGGSETSQRPVTAAALPSQTPTTTASSTQPSGGGATTPRQAIRLSDLQNILSTMNGKFSWSKNYMVYSQDERILNFGPSTIVVGNIVLTVTQNFFIRLEEICPF